MLGSLLSEFPSRISSAICCKAFAAYMWNWRGKGMAAKIAWAETRHWVARALVLIQCPHSCRTPLAASFLVPDGGLVIPRVSGSESIAITFLCCAWLRLPDSRELFQSYRTEPLLFFFANRANLMRNRVLLRINSRESPGLALRIARPSKVLRDGTSGST